LRVLKDKEQTRYSEYRTKRLALEAWDRMHDANYKHILFGQGELFTRTIAPTIQPASPHPPPDSCHKERTPERARLRLPHLLLMVFSGTAQRFTLFHSGALFALRTDFQEKVISTDAFPQL
jgi:hypothetical protein